MHSFEEDKKITRKIANTLLLKVHKTEEGNICSIKLVDILVQGSDICASHLKNPNLGEKFTIVILILSKKVATLMIV